MHEEKRARESRADRISLESVAASKPKIWQRSYTDDLCRLHYYWVLILVLTIGLFLYTKFESEDRDAYIVLSLYNNISLCQKLLKAHRKVSAVSCPFDARGSSTACRRLADGICHMNSDRSSRKDPQCRLWNLQYETLKLWGLRQILRQIIGQNVRILLIADRCRCIPSSCRRLGGLRDSRSRHWWQPKR